MAHIPEPIAIEPTTPESPGLSTPDEKSVRDAPYSSGSSEQDEEIVDVRAERNLVWRLDLIFLFVGFLGYVFKYLDQTNISNAYVSGMKEDLNLYGNELNLFTTFFNVGYVIMLFPSCIIVSHIGPGRWLPTCEVIWGILTCCLSLAKNAKTVYGLRFLIGFFEGSAWPGYFTLISQWYMPHEVALRMSLYNVAQPVGAMLSGALQGAISTNLDGNLGRTGWQWAFIVNGICTVFVALLAYFALPGYPERPNRLARWYLRDQDINAALARAKRVNRKPQRPITFKSFFRAFSFWQLWAFGLTWSMTMNTTPNQFFNLYLKSLTKSDGSKRFSVAQLNYIPIGGQAIAFVTEIVFSFLSDRTGRRLELLCVHSAISITSLSILIARPANVAAHMAGYFLNYFGFASMMLICAWATNNLQHEPEVRTILFSTGTTWAYIQNMFIPLLAYPASQAPNWKVGPKVYMAFAVWTLFVFFGIHFRLKYEAKRKAALKEQAAE